MLPSLVARDVEKGLKAFIQKEFPMLSGTFTDADGKNVLEAFLEMPNSLVKGPWVEVRLPFRKAPGDVRLPFTHLDFERMQLPHPYKHQYKAFWRLQHAHPETTIVATGTGSGKTECFLYPVVDYCLASREKGIKAIFVYPMNALAADQSRRVAALLHKVKELTGRVITAGLYTGDDAKKVGVMRPDSLISDREILRENPPDILLTNYKMLDFLLIRKADQTLWKDNGPGLMKYLVVDELHTFDGAQGTDLACLIRRLKERLKLGSSLACVGTSATIGGKDSISALCQYASDIFAVPVTQEAIITESRLDANEFLASLGEYTLQDVWPYDTLRNIPQNIPQNIGNHDDGQAYQTYVGRMLACWFPDYHGSSATGAVSESWEKIQLELAARLPSLPAFRRFVMEAQGVVNIHEMAQQWEASVAELKHIPGNRKERVTVVETLIDSLVAMISAARSGTKGNLQPFLQLRTQLWVRELARVVSTVSQTPEMKLAADTAALVKPLKMPVVGCRECYRAGWGGVIRGNKNASDAKVSADLNNFYQSWFFYRSWEYSHQDTCLFYPVASASQYQALLEQNQRNKLLMYWLCPDCQQLAAIRNQDETEIFEKPVPCSCGCRSRVAVFCPDMTDMTQKAPSDQQKIPRFVNQCPFCHEKGTLRIFGMSVASMAANIVSHVHGSRFSDDRHIIAFSDSVQDAAQRVGFISARNYRAVTRHALVYYLLAQPEKDIPLSQLFQQFSSFWKGQMRERHAGSEEEQELGGADFLATFIPPDMQWRKPWKIFSKAALDDENAILSSHGHWQRLLEDVSQRLAWDALIEFGLRSNTGRTVLRAGVAALYPAPELLEQAAESLWDHCRNHYPDLDFQQENMVPFLLGILEYMRSLGAFDPDDMHAARKVSDDFGEYLKTGNIWRFISSDVLPGYGKNYPPPVALMMTSRKGKDPYGKTILSAGKSRGTWCTNWFMKFSPLLGDALVQDLYGDALEILESRSLVRKKLNSDGLPYWVLPMQQWHVTTGTLHVVRCGQCGRHYHIASQVSHLWKGMRCMTSSCMGTLEKLDTPEKPENREIPFSSFPVRLNTHEHTSLIDGDTRHQVERSFGGGRNLWNINLLSATPTLEMGIDIGTLSTVLQCSMPPTQANYLQRIGRAGRRDGNALAVTIAGRDRHSEYFWANPAEMIEGEVIPPGVYLGAVSVLERQLVAFALGRWVAEASQNIKIPDTLEDIVSERRHKKDGQNGQVFPTAFLQWVHDHADSLYLDFVSMMTSVAGEAESATRALSEEGKKRLRYFVSGEASSEEDRARPSLAQRIDNAFREARLRREGWERTKQDLLRKRRNTLNRPEDDERNKELDEIRQQFRAIRGMLKSINRKKLLNFLTDEGLLPNYAFPEEGVEVESVIFSNREYNKNKKATDRNDDDADNRHEHFTFKRPISQALTELAPDSRFYANRHILHIDQFRVGSDSFERWRLCEGCAYAEKIIDPDAPVASACPNCGDTMWADVGRVRTMLRAHEIVAHADSKRDRISDNQDDRQTSFVSCQTFVHAEDRDVGEAWKIGNDDAFAFGFEFLKNVTIREINFGPYEGGGNGDPFRVANTIVPVRGYKLCRHCGRVYSRQDSKSNQKLHDFSCPYHGKERLSGQKDGDSPWIDGIFMYREMRSEAIRIRVPVSDALDAVGAEKGTQSLIAAIKVGLKNYFRGDVFHLQASVQTERSASGGGTDRYIVIYDTIPGGSGYLKELGRKDENTEKPENMRNMLEKAYDTIAHCECSKDPDMDGCYRCVYQYRDGRVRDQISRSVAETLLRRILQYLSEKIVRLNGSISSLTGSDASELERLFLERLRQQQHRGFDLQFYPTSSVSDAYRLSVPLDADARERWKQEFGRDPGEKLVWQLLLQQDLHAHRIALQSRPDFTFRPLTETVLAKRPDLEAHVFTDGWQYHADLLDKDTRKRQSILNIGARVWSLSWEDVAVTDTSRQQNGQDMPFYASRLDGRNEPKGIHLFWKGTQEQQDAKRCFQEMFYPEHQSSFIWLCKWLSDPLGFSENMKDAVRFAALTHKAKQYNEKDMAGYPRQVCKEGGEEIWFVPESLPFLLVWRLSRPKTGDTQSVRLVCAQRIDDASFDTDDMRKDRKCREQWQMFWQFANALQFGDGFWQCTVSNENDSVFDDQLPARSMATVDEPASERRWKDDFISVMREEDEEFYRHMLGYAQILMKKGIPAPDDMGVDGIGNRVLGKPTGLVWHDRVYLFAPEDSPEATDLVDIPGMTVVIAGTDNWIEDLRKGIQT